MNWLFKYLTSSIGSKIIMSLTGLFLCFFLVVHLIGNLQILIDDNGAAYNAYSVMMGNNPLIKISAYGLYVMILVHAFKGIFIWLKNKSARPEKYAVKSGSGTSAASRNMAILGIGLLGFLIMHFSHFWYAHKFGGVLEYIQSTGVKGEITPFDEIIATFTQPLWLALYLIAQVVIGLHLYHGFQSAFQSLGFNHKNYTPIIKGIGTAFSILVPLGFAIIPVVIFFRHAS